MTNIKCAGALFLSTKTQRFLFLLRTQGRTAGTWGLVGGRQEPTDKTELDTLRREIEEEIGFVPEMLKTIPIERYESSDSQFYYSTYIILVEDEFVPALNHEHAGYAWTAFNSVPRPLHQGVKTTLQNRTTQAKIETILAMIG